MTETTTLRMERTFQAPAQAVFDAWTSEEVMRRWWHAEHDWETTEAEVDLRVGGAVRVVMRNPHEDVEYGGGGQLHGDRPAEPPGVHLDLGRRHHAAADRARLRGGRRRHHRPLHPQRPVGRGGRALARGRLGQGVRQPRAHPGGGRLMGLYGEQVLPRVDQRRVWAECRSSRCENPRLLRAWMGNVDGDRVRLRAQRPVTSRLPSTGVSCRRAGGRRLEARQQKRVESSPASRSSARASTAKLCRSPTKAMTLALSTWTLCTIPDVSAAPG